MGEYFERNIAKFRYFVNFSSTFTIHFFSPNTRQDFGFFLGQFQVFQVAFLLHEKLSGNSMKMAFRAKKLFSKFAVPMDF